MQLPASEIREAVDAVFSDPAFQRNSLLERLGSWLLDLLRALLLRLDVGPAPLPLFWLLATFVGAIVIVALIRAGYLARSRLRVRATVGPGSERAGVAGDAWIMARRHASRGDYTAAAHALYAALLAFLADRESVELHESKTVGDYLRDLTTRSSKLLGRFRDFARSYEWVIYGQGSCDRDGYERLDALAHRVVESRG